MKNKRIAIVGAGVAGISLAILAIKQGYQVCLYERKNKVSSMGAGVTLWPNAMFVLHKMGLDDSVERAGSVPQFMHQYDQKGIDQSSLDIAELNALSGLSSVTILRRDLMRILTKALSDIGGVIHCSSLMTVGDISELAQKYDLVVGADGRMNSVVRQILYADEVRPVYQGFINIIGISPTSQKGRVGGLAIEDFRGHRERFGIVPVQADLCYWAGAWSTPIDLARPLSDCYREMRQRFSNWPEPVQQVIENYEQTSLKRIFVHDIDTLPYWHQGNILLIGDAAHAPLPTSGQGACQALEDVWHLIQCLDSKEDLGATLDGFYQQRINKTAAIQASGRQLAQKIFGESSKPAVSLSIDRLNNLWMQGLSC